MPYCQKCGNEILEDTAYCTQCGASLIAPYDVRYRRSPKKSWDIGRVLAVIFGSLLLITSLGLLVGGGGIMWVNNRFRDSDNFLISHEADFQVESYALVQKNIDIASDVSLPSNLWIPEPGDLVKLKVEVKSNDPLKECFLGIASENYALMYLKDVEYDEIIHFSWDYNPWRKTEPHVSYRTHTGEEPTGPPTMHSFWVAQVSGTGTQILEWEPTYGSYWIVAMNADGSADVDIEAKLGVKIPILRTIGTGIFMGGLILFFIGGIIFWWGLYPR